MNQQKPQFPVSTHIHHYEMKLDGDAGKQHLSVQTTHIPKSKQLYCHITETGPIGTMYLGEKSAKATPFSMQPSISIETKLGKRDDDDLERVVVRQLLGRLQLDQVLVSLCIMKKTKQNTNHMTLVKEIVKAVLDQINQYHPDLVLALEKSEWAKNPDEEYDDEFGPI